MHAALGIAYMSCDDTKGEADTCYNEIRAAWRAGVIPAVSELSGRHLDRLSSLEPV